MKEKVVEILIYLMTEMKDRHSVAEIDLASLTKRGYSQSEISAALSWLHEAMENAEGESTKLGDSSPSSWRFLHEAEKQVIGVEGYGYLIQLRELGLLRAGDLESVIERAMMTGYERLTLAELQEVITSIISTRFGEGKLQTRSIDSNKDTIH